MAWVKKKCFVVTAFYRDELYQENVTPMNEEDCVFTYEDALKLKEKYDADEDFENDALIEEEQREFWVEGGKIDG